MWNFEPSQNLITPLHGYGIQPSRDTEHKQKRTYLRNSACPLNACSRIRVSLHDTQQEMKQNETAHQTHIHVHTCTDSWNSQQVACTLPTAHRKIRHASATQTPVQAWMAKRVQKRHPNAIVWSVPSALCFPWRRKQTHWKCHSACAVAYSTGPANRRDLNDPSSRKHFQPCTPFSPAFVWGGTAAFTCRLLRGSCKAFVCKRSVSNANQASGTPCA